MSGPVFTVITANFNSGDKLAVSVDSVREQGVEAEHLIVDGVSTDRSLDLARRLAAASAGRVSVASSPDQGVYDAMNKGVATAAGRYVYFLGAGDVIRPGVLRQIERNLPRHDHGLIYGDVMMGHDLYGGPFSLSRLAHQNVCHQGAFYGRELYEWFGSFDLKYRYYADYEFNLRCFGDARVRPLYVPVVIADFEMGGVSRDGDPVFSADKLGLIRRHYRPTNYARARVALTMRESHRRLKNVIKWCIGRS